MTKVNVKLDRFGKMFTDKSLVEDKLYQIIDKLNEWKVTPEKFYSICPNKIHPFLMEVVEHVKYCLLVMIKDPNLLMVRKIKKLIM